MRMTTGLGPSSVVMSLDPTTGEMKLNKTGDGKAELVIDGHIYDEHKNRIGRFVEICELAVTSWETMLQQAGVPLP